MKHKLLAVTAALCFTSITVASDVADFFAGLKNYSAGFSQTVTQGGQLVQESVGNVLLKKPLKFRWDYLVPEKMQLISDGNRFYHYDIDLAQATSKPVGDVAGTAIATLLSDSKKIDKAFKIRSFAAPALKKKFPQQSDEWLQRADIFYELTPKKKNQNDMQATRVLIGITKNRQLTVFYAEDDYGQNTFLFDNIQQNGGIDDGEFIFNPPAGVDVLGE